MICSVLRVAQIGKKVVTSFGTHIGRSLAPPLKKADRFGFAPRRDLKFRKPLKSQEILAGYVRSSGL